MSVDARSLLMGSRPVWLVGLLSLALVVVAMTSDSVLNRDGMYYVDTARAMLASNAQADHDWLFFPAMLAGIADVLSIDPVTVAQAYIVITRVLLALCLFAWLSRARAAGTPHMAMLAALTVPWMLEYQTYLIRDSAAWLALVITLLLARLWVLNHQWRWLALMLPVALAGFLFRTEMLVLLAVPGWLALLAGWRHGWKTVVAVLAFAAVLAALALPVVRELVVSHVRFYLDTVASKPNMMLLPDFIAALEGHVNPYVRSDLSTVLVSGFVLMPIFGVIGLLGIYVVPLVFGVRRQPLAALRQDDGASAVMLLVFFTVVLAFVFVMQFVVGRYLVPIAICLMPWVHQGMQGMERSFPRASKVFVIVAVIAALSASFSSGGGKDYLREAGEYIGENQATLGTVYYTDARIAFYAGERYQPKQQLPVALAEKEAVAAAQSLALVVDKGDADITGLLNTIEQQYGFAKIVFEADNGDDKGVLILSR